MQGKYDTRQVVVNSSCQGPANFALQLPRQQGEITNNGTAIIVTIILQNITTLTRGNSDCHMSTQSSISLGLTG